MLREIQDRSTLRVVRQIAKGGMGGVCEAYQVGADGFEKRVAIKELLPALYENQRFVDMFIGEAKLVADLVHENIVQIYQFNRDEQGYYIIMEYVHGMSLAEFIRMHEAARLPEELAVFITSRIARGLAYAHSRRDACGRPLNIVHRDVCPNNIMVTTEGLPKLGDFGIAKAATNLLAGPEDNVSMGKMGYMSPEQAWGKDVDHRSDIYSLGLVLFELLALKRARDKWSGNPLFAAARGRVDWDALPGDTTPDLREILDGMLETDPEKRFADTDKLGHDLEYFIYHKGYGPTVVTLEKYLRELCPSLYEFEPAPAGEGQ